MASMNIRITFIEELLGTASADPEIHEKFIVSKAPDAPSMKEEIEAVGADEVIEKSMTIFPRNKNGKPILYDYQIKGFFKDTCGILHRDSTTKSSKVKAYKKEIDGLVDVWPRMLTMHLPGGKEIASCQRPLRASTAQGERVALANSESLPAGTWFECEVEYDLAAYRGLIIEWLNRGYRRGIGQWRNSGKGRFFWEELDKDGKVIGGNYDKVIAKLMEYPDGEDLDWMQNANA